IQQYESARKRFLLGYISPIAKEIENRLKELEAVKRISLAGSIRRRKETIGDVDILVTSQQPLEVMNYFTQLPEVKRVVAKGKTKSTLFLTNNLQVDLRVVEEESFGSALQYFTGSKEHNIRLRELALEKNWKLSEYGLMDKNTDKKLAGEEEVEIYQALGLEYIEPELRENRGEIEAALEGRLPNLIRHEDIKGDVHVHTTWSDGSHSIEEMAETAQSLGYEYLGICDHSKTLQIAHGLTDEEICKQMDEIERINQQMENFTILKGIEANIDSEGELDVGNEVLKDLDVVVASIHSGFQQTEKKITERVLTAMTHDPVNIIAHPTGRIINRREAYPIDLSRIFETASQLGVLMEINAFPNRLDLSDINCFKAKDYGVRFSIATDSHQKEHLRYMKIGVDNARRGWLEKTDVINTLNLKGIKELLDT
ncbi:MAG: DNA polymerase/3'-5' exonuclease PolX, partial [Thermoproteota archaeon]